jgi:hypothetical protein
MGTWIVKTCRAESSLNTIVGQLVRETSWGQFDETVSAAIYGQNVIWSHLHTCVIMTIFVWL